MSARTPRDWTEQHDGPPSLESATTLVTSNRRLLFRAALPTGLLGGLVAWAAYAAGDVVFGSVIMVLSLAASAGRTVWWARGFGSRSLVATQTHLVLCKAGVPEQWVSWSGIDGVTVVRSDPLPEWSRNRIQWFHVEAQPELAVMPPRAFVGGFGDMLISSRESRDAADRVQHVVHAHGLPCSVR